MGFFDIFDDMEAPAFPSPGQIARDTFYTQRDIAPEWMKLEEEFAPRKTRLASLLKEQSTLADLDLFGKSIPRLTDLQAMANTASRRADIGDMSMLAPDYQAAITKYDPLSSSILEKLKTDALDELEKGYELPASFGRQVTQSERAGLSSRGMSVFNSNPSLARELFSVGSAAEAFKRRRVDDALRAVTASQQFSGDPWQVITGRSSGAIPAAMSVPGAGQSAGPAFDPFSQWGLNVAENRYNAEYNPLVANQSKNAAILGGLFEMAGSMGGASIKKWG